MRYNTEMYRRAASVDRLFLSLALTLVAGGYFIFASASFGLLLKTDGVFASAALTQLASIALGLLFCLCAARAPLPWLKKYAWVFALIALVAMLLVLVPGMGVARGGAQRWFSIFGVSLQPGELFKLAAVVWLTAWLSGARRRHEAPAAARAQKFFWMFSAFLIGAGTLFLLQPDTDSFLILFVASCAVYRAAGLPRKHLVYLTLAAALALAALFYMRPYLLERLTVFLHPDRDPQGAGYQLQQSLIAVGSGGLVGKGFGRSVQKFERLPEPTNDSIFAIFAEEFGLIGTLALLLLFSALTLRGLRIAARAPDPFGGLLALGCTLLIAGAAFLNIASMLGLAPLSGLALPFISRGGTSMLAALTAVGLVLNVSRGVK